MNELQLQTTEEKQGIHNVSGEARNQTDVKDRTLHIKGCGTLWGCYQVL
jgi:hypothetical protein